jgi:hypothetical protein
MPAAFVDWHLVFLGRGSQLARLDDRWKNLCIFLQNFVAKISSSATLIVKVVFRYSIISSKLWNVILSKAIVKRDFQIAKR